MKKTIYYIALTALLLALPFGRAYAGTSSNTVEETAAQDDGTVKDKIENVLSKLPAETVDDFNALMQELAATGKEGVETLAAGLVPQTEGQNSITEYALNGLVAYVSAEGREALTKEVRAGLRSAIDACTDKVNQAFLMTLLQLIGTADDAPTYVKFLDDPELKAAAISGLIALPDDGKAVQKVLKKSKTYDEGLAYLAAHKGLPYPKSSKKVDEVAEAQELLKSDQSHERVNGLHVLLAAGETDPQEMVLDALRDSDREYRAAALMEANDFADEDFYSKVAALFPELEDEAKADVVNWFGDNHVTSQSAVVVKETASQNPELALAAIKAAGKLGGKDALEALALCLEGPYGKNAVTALISFKADVTKVVMNALNGSPAAQANALKLAGARHIIAAAPKVFELAKAEDKEVRKAACKALAGVCTDKDFGRLCNLLDNCSEENAPDIQAAIVASAQGLSDKDIESLKEDAYSGSRTAFIALVNIKADLTADLLALAEQNGQWRDEALTRLCVLMEEYVDAEARAALIVRGLNLEPSASVMKKLLTTLGDSHDPAGIDIALGYIDNAETAEAAAYAIKTIAAKNPDIIKDVKPALTRARDVYSALAASDADAGYAIDEINGLLAK